MKNWWTVALGVVFGLLAAGVVTLASQPPRGHPIELLPPPTPVPIQVHISGAVQNPGLYALLPGSRVQDAIEAAGGLSDNADLSGLNLAAPLEDGSLIQISTLQPTIAPTEQPLPSSRALVLPVVEPPPTEDSETALININTASQAELETLSGIGPVTAQKIIDYRNANGPFAAIDEIQKVSGIGPATFEKIKDFITVGAP